MDVTTEMTATGAEQWQGGADPYPGSMRVEHDCPDCALRMELPLLVWISCDCDERWWALRPAAIGHLEAVDTHTDPNPPPRDRAAITRIRV